MTATASSYSAATGNIVHQAFTTLGAAAVAAVGNTVCMAVDLGTKQIWFRVNGGNWNNSGTANPDTPTGGLIFTITAGPFAAKWNSFGTTGDAVTANFGGTAYAFTKPSTFGNW